jgi:hypothetical protein
VAQRRADALGLLAETALEHMGAKERGEPYQVVVHVDAEVLASPESEGQCCVEDGPAISAETARRIACDAAMVPLEEDSEGNVLSVGRKSRKVSRALWRALRSRDETCAFPGCERSRALTVHHVTHWAEGGETSPENLVLLCNLCRYRHNLHYAALVIIPRWATPSRRDAGCRRHNHNPLRKDKSASTGRYL